MGAAAPAIIKAFSITDLAKYCLNAMEVESECCDTCYCKYHTDPIPVEEPEYNLDIDREGLHIAKK